jgi:hypothetical protein
MPSPNGHRAERDGCGCPAHVVWCAHFGETSLALYDTALTPDCSYRVPLPSRFIISTMRGRWGTNAPWCEHPSFKGKTLVAPLNTADLPAAEAEFRERERELLGQEA